MEDESGVPSNFNQILSPTHHINQLSVFPPSNHEDLPIPQPPPPQQPPHAPLSADSDDHSPPPPPPPPPKHNKYINHTTNYTHLIKWFDFALHFWNSKLHSFFSHLPSLGSFLSFRSLAATASCIAVVWFWVRRRPRRRLSLSGCGRGDKESVEHLKALIKSKDEKILQLLEQIAQMNKVLLARHRIPVLKGS